MYKLASTIGALALILASFTASAFSETALSGLMSDIRAAYSWTCTGSACDAVWTEQVRSINALNAYVDYQMPDGMPLSQASGAQANRLASVVCSATARASYETLIWLVNAENRGIARLATVQRRAGVQVRICNKVVQ